MEKEKWFKINDLGFFLKKMKREEKVKHKVSRWKKITKDLGKINKIESRKVKKINEVRSYFSETVKLSSQIDKKKKKHWRLNILTKRIIRGYFTPINFQTWTK